MRLHVIVCLLALVLAPLAQARAEAVDLELVLLADASGSIGNDEIRFQRQGYADALASPDVLDAIANAGRYQKIAVTYMEWGQWDSQVVVVPWRIIATADDARAFNAELLAAPRLARGRNAIGNALIKAAAEIAANEHEGVRKVIDLSADSVNSWGGRACPRRAKPCSRKASPSMALPCSAATAFRAVRFPTISRRLSRIPSSAAPAALSFRQTSLRTSRWR